MNESRDAAQKLVVYVAGKFTHSPVENGRLQTRIRVEEEGEIGRLFFFQLAYHTHSGHILVGQW